ncbi:bifunctional 2-C-methyl-D-erythritol 4-phosphate cytidylyltransferase/2-C-methyl-D-erythritol 2,4-cyclodiphosphate synthase [Oricola sp.]|uniref:bifunctional 2-C-methyl-D-erythritol 4-phosphate cytidylyltransferase/2-C-methyl-D-erythritol 2,4-cyclodiphosphate synthase n=1 Tax=Oricola sp. TaxID=1979950 RepID=UPI003BACA686
MLRISKGQSVPISQPEQSIGVVIVAAGRGERAGDPSTGPKQYRDLAGKPVIRRTVDAFRAWNRACPIVIVRHADDADLLARAIGETDANIHETLGGITRQASVLNGLRHLAATDQAPSHVLIHDAARPLVSVALLERIEVTLAGEPDVGVLPALPISETIKETDTEGSVIRTVPRTGLYRAQTPQAFPLAAIIDAHVGAAGKDDTEFTDDASVFEWAQRPVRVIEGDNSNIKLTYPQDFKDATRMLDKAKATVPDVRVGHGYDTHQLVAGDGIVLCGVKIEHPFRLSGHSDADVGLHALTDALLATVASGDIGSHFPPSDPQWKGANSDIFLRHAAELVRAAGGTITHCDVTLVCEAPKIGPHRDAMRAAVAGIMDIDVARVSVKATTNERIGFVGRGEGIVALATATAVFASDGVGS